MQEANGSRTRRVDRRSALSAIGAGGLGLLAGCLGGDGASGDETIQVGQTLVGPASGSLWNTGHVNAIEAAAGEFDGLEYTTEDEVDASDAGQFFETFVDQNYDLIIAANFNYGDLVSQMSTEHEGTHFEVAGGVQRSKMTDNMGIFYTKFYEPAYLAGMAAGMMTESNLLGHVASFPIPTTIRRFNAYFLGARAVNPDVSMQVRYTSAWYDPGASSQAVNALVDEGADVIHSGTDSKAPIETARENDVWAVGMYIPEMAEAGGDRYITGVLSKWETPYINAIEKIADDSWEAEWRWYGIEEGFADIDDWGPNVPQEVKDEVGAKREEAMNGNLDYWAGSRFEGVDEDFLYNEMAEYVDGIQGEPPE